MVSTYERQKQKKSQICNTLAEWGFVIRYTHLKKIGGVHTVCQQGQQQLATAAGNTINVRILHQ